MEQEFITLLKHPNYEISTEYPWIIRRKRDGKILKQRTDKDGYLIIALDRINHGLHRVVGEQFISNPDNLPQIDHISRDRTDNRLDNIRWASCKINRRNRISNKGVKYEYLDALPDGYIPFTSYIMTTGEIHEFDDLYIKIEKGIPTFITNESERQYRILREQPNRSLVNHHSINGKQVSICFSRINKPPQPISTTTTTTETTTITTADETKTTTKTTTTTTKYQTESEVSDEEYEHFEPEEDYQK
jgi:hypothetical protein